MIQRKKKFSLLWLFIAVSVIIAGCQSTRKIPAGDITIYKKFADEIKIMHSKLSPDSELKFNTAVILFNNIDFSFVREPKNLVKILGRKDAILISNEGKEYIQYRYRFGDKYIFVRFLITQNMLVAVKIKSNVVNGQEN